MIDNQQNSIRHPRGIVKLNGSPISGWTSWSVDSNAFQASDTFKVTFAANSLPADRDVAWLSAQTKIDVEILAGLPADPSSVSESDYTSLILGSADVLDWDPVSTVVELSGRDLSARLIDKQVSAKHANRKLQDIAGEVAQEHGLELEMDQAPDLEGVLNNIDTSNLHLARTEWDLVSGLATEAGMSARVAGKKLLIKAREDSRETVPLIWTPPRREEGKAIPAFDGISLKFSRTLSMSAGTRVRVKSYNVKTGRRAKGEASSVYTDGNGKVLDRQFPGLTDAQCRKKAKSLHSAHAAHELKLEFSLPADTRLTVDHAVRIQGTGTAWDQDFDIDSISRRMSIKDGFLMTVTAKKASKDKKVEVK